jgi:hypothetical protein
MLDAPLSRGMTGLKFNWLVSIAPSLRLRREVRYFGARTMTI